LYFNLLSLTSIEILNRFFKFLERANFEKFSREAIHSVRSLLHPQNARNITFQKFLDGNSDGPNSNETFFAKVKEIIGIFT
jgi:hypothetical protein